VGLAPVATAAATAADTLWGWLEVEPPMRTFPGSGHPAACHSPLHPVLADSAATAVEAP
jgi:hypothetical protein